MKHFVLFLATLALFFGTGGKGKADIIYNAATDFSTASNPNGVWTYGYSLSLAPGAGLTLYTKLINPVGNTNYIGWTANISLGDPTVVKNIASATQTNGTPSLLPGELAFHPGPSDQFSFVRFTAPQAGLYSIATTFTGRDTHGTTTDVHVLDKGISLFAGEVTGFGPTSDVVVPNIRRQLSAGDTIDFAVGFGTDRSFGFDTTGLEATITQILPPQGGGGGTPGVGPAAVPEPTSLSLFGMAGLSLLGYAWRRRKQ